MTSEQGLSVNGAVWGALVVLALQVGCAGRASQSGSQGGAAVAGAGGASGLGLGLGSESSGAAGLSSAADAGASSAASSGGGVSLPGEGEAGTTTMSQGGSEVLDAGTAVADDNLSEPISDADLKQPGLVAAGCHSVSRSISCIGLPTTNVCAFLSDGRACKADADCDWLIIPDCCCTVPRYVLSPHDAALGAHCTANGCGHGFVIPG